MSKSLQKFICNLIAFIMAFTAIFSSSVLTTFAASSSKAATDLTGTIWTIGDSTVCYYDKTNENSEKYNYRQGWGMRLGDYFNSDAKVENIARSGRSSRDFINYTVGKDDPKYGQYGAKWYDYFKENLKPGDYVFIQLNHNDQKEPLSYKNNEFVINGNYGKTDADGGISTAAGLPGWQDSTDGYVAIEGLPKVAGTCTADGKLPSYEWFLYNYYVKVALDKGAYPVLVTPVVRGSGSKDTDGFYPNVTGSDTSHTKVNWKPLTQNIASLKDLLGNMDYIQAVKDVAAYANSQQSDYVVPVIDLYAKSGTYWKNYADAHNGSVNDLHANDKGVPGHKDRTHLSREGAFAAAGLVVEGIKEQKLPIAAYLKETPPDKPGDDASDEKPSESTTSSSEKPGENTTIIIPVGSEKLGDFNLDDKVDADDASNVLAYVLNKAQENFKDYTERNLKVADVDGDGIITAKDASQILQKTLNSGNFDFPVEVTTSSETPVESTSDSETPVETTTKTSSSENPAETTSSIETPAETTTSSEVPVETTTKTSGGDTPVETTSSTETPVETTTEGAPVDIQDKIYAGVDVAVDARANSDADRAEQPIFKTVNEAINYANSKNPKSEADRIVIGIVPGTYREQVIIDTPYLTLKRIDDSTSTEKEAKITWYYGIGMMYHSIGSNGYYDASRKNATDYVAPADRWGAAVRINGKAKDFIAENICFENSYNLYVTQEELDDGIKAAEALDSKFYSDGKVKLPERTSLKVGSEEVRKSNYRERCAGLAAEADRATFKGCTVLGTQDSLYVGDNCRLYFENCTIEGNTDFIFGGAQVVFNDSILQVGGDPAGDNATFTAMSTPLHQKGALIYNCKLTTRSDVKSTANGSVLGRPWKADAKVTLINTIIDNSTADPTKCLVSAEGWADMSGAQPEDARFAEYNSVGPDGKAIDTSSRRGSILDPFDAILCNPYDYTKEIATSTTQTLNDDWDPGNFKPKYDAIADDLAEVNLGLTDNQATEDFELPAPVAGYEYYWVSSNTNYATVSNVTNKVTVVRPIWSVGNQEITLTAYMKKANSIDGIKKEFKFIVKAEEKSADTFDLSGNITLPSAPTADLTVNIKVDTTEGLEVYNQDIVIKKGVVIGNYKVEGLTPGDYKITITLSDEDSYAVKDGYIKTFTGVKDQASVQNIEIAAIKDIETSSSTNLIAVNPVSGYTVTPKTEAGIAAYNFNKASSVAAGGAYYWDLAAILEPAGNNMDAFKTADKVTINFKVKYPALSGQTTYFDILGNGDATQFAYKAAKDNTRYARFIAGGNYNQMDVIPYTSTGVSGVQDDSSQILNLFKAKFEKNEAADKWYDLQLIIDFKNGKVIPMGIKNSSIPTAITFDMPTDIDRSKLYFVVYPQSSKGEDNFYISNATVSYKVLDDTPSVPTYTVSGNGAEGISIVNLVNKANDVIKYSAGLTGENKEFSFAKVPNGTYYISAECSSDYKDPVISGSAIKIEEGESQKKYIVVQDANVSGITVSATRRTYTISGIASDGIASIVLTDTTDPTKTVTVQPDETKKFNIPEVLSGTYYISATLKDEYENAVITGNGITTEDGKYVVNVNRANVVGLNISASAKTYAVSVKVSDGITGVTFTNKTDATKVFAAVLGEDGKYSANLPNGDYKVSFVFDDAVYENLTVTGVTEEGTDKIVTVNSAAVSNIEASVTERTEVATKYTVSGTIDANVTAVKFTKGASATEATIDGTNFTASLTDGDYIVTVECNAGYRLKELNGAEVTANEDGIYSITINGVDINDISISTELIVYAVSGTASNVKSISFVKDSDEPINATIGEDGAFSLNLQDGTYTVNIAANDGYAIKTVTGLDESNGTYSITVNGAAITDINITAESSFNEEEVKAALNKYFTDEFGKDGDNYIIDTKIDIPALELPSGNYTYTIASANNSVTAYGFINRPSYNGNPSVTDTITITVANAANITKEYTYGVSIQKKTTNTYFNDLSGGESIFSADGITSEIVKDANLNRFVDKYTVPAGSSNIFLTRNLFSTEGLENGIYAIDFSIKADDFTFTNESDTKSKYKYYLQLLDSGNEELIGIKMAQSGYQIVVSGHGTHITEGSYPEYIYNNASNPIAKKWFNFRFVVNTIDNVVDIYCDNGEVAHYACNPGKGKFPANINIICTPDSSADSTFYISKLNAHNYYNEFVNALNMVVPEGKIPENFEVTETEQSKTIALPSKAGNFNVEWTVDTTNAKGIKIDETGNLVLTPQMGAVSGTITATVTDPSVKESELSLIKYVKEYKVSLAPTSSDIFVAKGKITLNGSVSEDIPVTVSVTPDGGEAITQSATIPANGSSVTYEIPNLPAGTYNVSAVVDEAIADKYGVSEIKMPTIDHADSTDVEGVDFTISGIEEKVYIVDFNDGVTHNENVTLPTGYSGDVVDGRLKINVAANTNIKGNDVKYSWDLKDLMKNIGNPLTDSVDKKFTFSFDYDTEAFPCYNDDNGKPRTYFYFTNTTDTDSKKIDDSAFTSYQLTGDGSVDNKVRIKPQKTGSQYTSKSQRMENIVNLNKSVANLTTNHYDLENYNALKPNANGTADTGINSVDVKDLVFVAKFINNITGDTLKSDIIYYLDNLTVKYLGYVPAADIHTVSGTISDKISSVKLIGTRTADGKTTTTYYYGTIDNGKVTFNKVPVGEYIISACIPSGADLDASGTGVNETKLTVSSSNITDLVLNASGSSMPVIPAAAKETKLLELDFDSLTSASSLEVSNPDNDYKATIVEAPKESNKYGKVLKVTNPTYGTTSKDRGYKFPVYFNENPFSTDKTSVVSDKNKKYAISFDIMQSKATNNGNGWKVMLGSDGGAWGIRWNGESDSETLDYLEKGQSYMKKPEKETDKPVTPPDITKYPLSNYYNPTNNKLIDVNKNEWYNWTFVVDTPNNHVDVYVNGTYMKSYGLTAGKLPDRLHIETYYVPEKSIYVDNIKVYEYEDPYADELKTALSSVDTSNITAGGSLTVPTRTSSKYDITWTSSDPTNVTFDKETGMFTFASGATGSITLTASIKTETGTYEGYPGGGATGAPSFIESKVNYNITLS